MTARPRPACSPRHARCPVPRIAGGDTRKRECAVSWTVPAFGIIGGAAITSYEVTCSTTRRAAVRSMVVRLLAPALECTVDGLTNGVSYSFSVAR